MNIKLGDLVLRRGERNDMVFRVSGFDGDYAVLKGIKVPIITICALDKLIKINRKRENINILKRVK
ncbi:MAG TPA: hypothetical protein VKY40_09710 [Halanaerobiales bacterium]|nr:hypothetical protein [Halanaerobiales bacterium]